MKQRIFSGIFVVATVVIAFLSRLIDVRLFDVFAMALSLFSTLELIKIMGDRVTPLQKWLAIIFPLTIFPIAVFLRLFALVYAVAYFLLALILTVTTFKQKIVDGKPEPIDFSGFGTLLLLLFYPTVPFTFLTLINGTLTLSTFALLSVVVISMASDILAYLFGSLLKGKQLASAISPKKTLSGFIAGIIGSALTSVALYYVCVAFGYNPFFGLETFSVIFFLVITGVFFGLTSQVGDLFESAIKRALLVKDTGTLIPGHGGLLDRADSFVFTAVAVYMIYSFLG
ncbi:MAG: phosphatidate cytidylyltransferase [Clostridia bacterium]|nr:phosphatidate cytidylyltransferase [Clostridia bacterium]